MSQLIRYICYWHRWEIEVAITNGCYLNVDSTFDARHIASAARDIGKKTSVLIRLNPALDAMVHPYNSTALADSKFGVELSQLDKVIKQPEIKNRSRDTFPHWKQNLSPD